jgi:hypothetical protein
MGFLDSSATILAERASVVLYGWAREGDEQAARALAFQYPFLNHDLVPNVVAALLFLYGSHTRYELARRLDEWQVSEDKRSAILKAHQEYAELKAHDERAANYEPKSVSRTYRTYVRAIGTA